MSFTFRKAVRDGSSPLLIGLIGPSGGGKTLSALRLATGIQKVRGGKIAGIDTEARRMLHYAESYDFQHLHFGEPFSSERYLQALKAAATEAAGGVVIVDSMSHEHEGQGGYLEYHEAELDRIAGDDWKKRERATFTAWIKPAAARRRLINSLLQLESAFIFCFRSKEKLRIVTGGQPIPLGWQAIAGDEFSYEMTVRCLLGPGANGVPDWSVDAFKNLVAKRPNEFKNVFADGLQLNEDIGEQAALWAKGVNIPKITKTIDDYLPVIAAITAPEEVTKWYMAHKEEWSCNKELDAQIIAVGKSHKEKLLNVKKLKQPTSSGSALEENEVVCPEDDTIKHKDNDCIRGACKNLNTCEVFG